VADNVAEHSHSEDALVELKARWPDPADAARRIAAHANAARGATILWLIGIDETDGVCGAPTIELSDWFAAVKAQFDNVYPDLTDLNVPIDGKTIVALAFRTDRAPYLVKNPRHGQKDGGPITWEVPWREGRSTRTATRQDLLRLLAPLAPLPDVECLSFAVRIVEEWTDGAVQVHKWYAEGSLYVAPTPGVTVTIPTHRASLQAGSTGQPSETQFGGFLFYVHDTSAGSPVLANHAGATIRSPGLVFFSATVSASTAERTYPEELLCNLQFSTVGALVPCRVVAALRPRKRGNNEVAHWALQGDA
jgi:hypothetical protein